MTAQNQRKLPCPTCQKIVLWNENFPYRPFCSKRCQLIDFGEWAEEKHRIPDSTPAAITEEDTSDSDPENYQ